LSASSILPRLHQKRRRVSFVAGKLVYYFPFTNSLWFKIIVLEHGFYINFHEWPFA
jgi:hypothetical protein